MSSQEQAQFQSIPIESIIPTYNFNTEVPQPYSAYLPFMNNIHFDNPQRNKNQGWAVYMKPQKGQVAQWSLQMVDFDLGDQLLRAPFGLSEPMESSTDKNRKTLDLTIENQTQLEFLKALDRLVLNTAKANRLRWFRKDETKLPDSALEAFYKPIVTAPGTPKAGEEREYKPTFRTKVVAEGENACRIVHKIGEDPRTGEWLYRVGHWTDLINDKKRNILNLKGCTILPIAACTGIWFMATQFGCGFQCTDIIIVHPAARPKLAFTLPGGKSLVQATTAQIKRLSEGYAMDVDMQDVDDEQEDQMNGVLSPEQSNGSNVVVQELMTF